MPSWNIHLELGNRLADKMKLSGSERKEFLFGCLLPDINNGYINTVKVRKEHEDTHYAFNQKSSLNFYAENRTKIKQREPIYLGYLFHLYTDGFFNYDYYRTIKRTKLGKNLGHDEKLRIKHHDFWLYDTNFHHFLGISDEDLNNFVDSANQISVTSVTAEDIINVEQILKKGSLNDNIKNSDYKFYTKRRLDQLMEDVIESFSNDYLEEPYA